MALHDAPPSNIVAIPSFRLVFAGSPFTPDFGLRLLLIMLAATRYYRALFDDAAFAKDGDNHSEDSRRSEKSDQADLVRPRR
jgi:hypothetical protein